MTYGHRDNPLLKDWKYLQKKKAGAKGNKLSEDGDYILDKNGKVVCKHITRCDDRGGMGLFWLGWITRLERIQSLVVRLAKQQGEVWDNHIEPLMNEILGKKKQRTVWVVSEKGLFGYAIEKRPYDHYLSRQLSKKAREELKKDTFAWSYRTPDGTDNLHLCQLPPPSIEGVRLHELLERRETIWRRLRLAQNVLAQCVNMRLSALSETYGAGDIIRFKIGTHTLTFKRASEYNSWETLSGVIDDLDIYAVKPNVPHWSENWRYEHLYNR